MCVSRSFRFAHWTAAVASQIVAIFSNFGMAFGTGYLVA
jgi:hypothetical protein